MELTTKGLFFQNCNIIDPTSVLKIGGGLAMQEAALMQPASKNPSRLGKMVDKKRKERQMRRAVMLLLALALCSGVMVGFAGKAFAGYAHGSFGTIYNVSPVALAE